MKFQDESNPRKIYTFDFFSSQKFQVCLWWVETSSTHLPEKQLCSVGTDLFTSRLSDGGGGDVNTSKNVATLSKRIISSESTSYCVQVRNAVTRYVT